MKIKQYCRYCSKLERAEKGFFCIRYKEPRTLTTIKSVNNCSWYKWHYDGIDKITGLPRVVMNEPINDGEQITFTCFKAEDHMHIERFDD